MASSIKWPRLICVSRHRWPRIWSPIWATKKIPLFRRIWDYLLMVWCHGWLAATIRYATTYNSQSQLHANCLPRLPLAINGRYWFIFIQLIAKFMCVRVPIADATINMRSYEFRKTKMNETNERERERNWCGRSVGPLKVKFVFISKSARRTATMSNLTSSRLCVGG